MKKLIDFLKVISDETRLRIVILLAQESLCVCEISGILDLSQPKVSKHLSKLRDLNLVKDQRAGKYIMYSLNCNEALNKELIEKILENIDTVPELKNDSQRISLKSEFLNRCNLGN